MASCSRGPRERRSFGVRYAVFAAPARRRRRSRRGRSAWDRVTIPDLPVPDGTNPVTERSRRPAVCEDPPGFGGRGRTGSGFPAGHRPLRAGGRRRSARLAQAGGREAAGPGPGPGGPGPAASRRAPRDRRPPAGEDGRPAGGPRSPIGRNVGGRGPHRTGTAEPDRLAVAGPPVLLRAAWPGRSCRRPVANSGSLRPAAPPAPMRIPIPLPAASRPSSAGRSPPARPPVVR